jgi:hypothetical protein
MRPLPLASFSFLVGIHVFTCTTLQLEVLVECKQCQMVFSNGWKWRWSSSLRTTMARGLQKPLMYKLWDLKPNPHVSRLQLSWRAWKYLMYNVAGNNGLKS